MSKLTKIYICEMLTAILLIVVTNFFTTKPQNLDFEYDGTWFVYSENEKIMVKSGDKLDCVGKEDEMVLKTVLPSGLRDGKALAFFTVHQAVSVRVGDEVLYSFDKLEGELGKTPGSNWNLVNIPARISGGILTITLTSEYDATSGRVPKFYYGDTYSMIRSLLGTNVVFCFISVMMVVAGIAVLACWLFIRRKLRINNSLFYLSMFAITGGIWSAVESYIPTLVFGNNALMSRLGFLMLMLLPYPFIKFVGSVYDMQKFMPARFYRVLALANFIIQNILVYLRILEYREMVVATHLVIGIGGVIIVVMTIIKGLRKEENSVRPYAHIFAVSMIAVCFSLEVIRYYFDTIIDAYDAAIFIRIGLMIYIVILGFDSLRQISHVILSSQRAEKLEKVAYTDPLTGLGNRTAYLKLVREIPESELPDYSVIGLDINNLKHINDTYGHSSGDRYIMFCAAVIAKTIGEMGSIYRMGGDEFCVVIKDLDAIKLDEVYAEIRRLVNEKKNEFDGNIGIAHGFAAFDLHNDKSLDDTLNRADVRMYEHKKQMKSCITD